MKPPEHAFYTLLLAVVPSLAVAGTAPAKQPNIVFIMADDMGWAQPGFNGGRADLTPNMDALAASGMRLNEFYTHSVCAPTRAAFLTGRYAFRSWSDWRSEDFGKPSYLARLGLDLALTKKGEPTRRIHALETEERTIAEALHDSGYFTSIIGKWHLGEWLPEHLPMGQGFEHQYGHYAWGIDYYTRTIAHNAPARFAVYDWHRNQKPIFEEGYTTDLIAAEAERVIRSRKDDDRPFFIYVAFNAVHGPLNPPPGFEGDEHSPLAIRDAMLKRLDHAVGQIIDAIDGNGFRENTLVVFTNDNGPVLEQMSRPYRGTKNTTYEGGVRQPAILRWPGHVAPGTSQDGLMFVADFFPTFITLAGGEHIQELAIDGIDMTRMLFEGEESPRTEIVFDVSGSVRLPTIRSGEFKLMGDVLYNIADDPSEQSDIAQQHVGLVKRLKSRLQTLGEQRPPLGTKPLLMEPPQPYVYGLQEQHDIPDWLIDTVDAVRATQPREWAPGETPWPKAPTGANASRMDGLKDESAN